MMRFLEPAHHVVPYKHINFNCCQILDIMILNTFEGYKLIMTLEGSLLKVRRFNLPIFKPRHTFCLKMRFRYYS